VGGFFFFFLINMGRRKMGKYNIKGTQVRWATPTKECKQSKDGETRK
jgi:hypothetical protein